MFESLSLLHDYKIQLSQFGQRPLKFAEQADFCDTAGKHIVSCYRCSHAETEDVHTTGNCCSSVSCVSQ